MQLLARLISYLNDGTELPPGLVSFMGTKNGQEFVIKLVEMDGVLNSHVLASLFPEPPLLPAEPTKVELTEYQQEAEDLIDLWLKEDPAEHPYFLVKGYAGSGKSWFSGHLKKRLASHPRQAQRHRVCSSNTQGRCGFVEVSRYRRRHAGIGAQHPGV